VTKPEDTRDEIEALQAKIAQLLSVPSVRAHITEEARRAEQERAKAEREAAYKLTAEYRYLQEQRERERALRAEQEEAAHQRREARRAVALIEDPDERNAAITAMSDADRSQLFTGDLSFEELAEVMLCAPEDWWTTWCREPLYYSQQTKVALATLTYELPTRFRVTVSADAPTSVTITSAQFEALSPETRNYFVTGCAGDYRYHVREHEWSPVADAAAAAVLRSLEQKGCVALEPLTWEQNCAHQGRIWIRSYDRSPYPRRTRKTKKRKTTKTSE
jgi:hypothetical protein